MSPRARANRTDLNAPPTEPVTAAPNQEYGAAGAQRAAESVIPIGTPTETPTTGPGPRPASATQKPLPQPGEFPWLDPTNRPDEPVTTGLPSGPGAGPEVMHQAPPLVSDTLASLAASPNASARVIAMAQVAKSLGV